MVWEQLRLRDFLNRCTALHPALCTFWHASHRFRWQILKQIAHQCWRGECWSNQADGHLQCPISWSLVVLQVWFWPDLPTFICCNSMLKHSVRYITTKTRNLYQNFLITSHVLNWGIRWYDTLRYGDHQTLACWSRSATCSKQFGSTTNIWYVYVELVVQQAIHVR